MSGTGIEKAAFSTGGSEGAGRGLILGVLFAALLAVALGGASVGLPAVGAREVLGACLGWACSDWAVPDEVRLLVFDLRLPRVALGAVAGMGLALAGAATQGVLLNPLVSPVVLGVSAGAAFGAALAIVLGWDMVGAGRWLVVGNAFAAAMLAMFTTYGIARVKGSSRETIILAGIAVGYIFSALVAILQYVARDEDLRSVVFWLMGSLWNARLATVMLILPLVAVIFALLMVYAWDLNVLAAGEEVAVSLGVKVRRLRLLVLTAGALVTAGVVAFTGAIGFVGLMAPHMARILVGMDHRYLVPASGLLGAILLLAADTAARSLVWPVEVPVGIMTSLVGGPFFIYLLWRRKKDWWG